MMTTCLLSMVLACTAPAETEATVSAAQVDDHGFRNHTVEAPQQRGPTQIRVLVPDALAGQRRYVVLYVLPVEAGREQRYGDGLLEIKQHDLHNKYGVIFVAPTFSDLPWYADHPSDPAMRQESYFVNVVVPFIDANYPVLADSKGRLLLGFSKSGWGAWTLLLRHPEVFGRAAAWDAPLALARAGPYGSGPIFGTQENFENYHVVTLLQQKAPRLRNGKRLILTGFGNFQQDHRRIHQRLNELGIPHVYRDGPQRKHNWHSGWVSQAVELLLERNRPR